VPSKKKKKGGEFVNEMSSWGRLFLRFCIKYKDDYRRMKKYTFINYVSGRTVKKWSRYRPTSKFYRFIFLEARTYLLVPQIIEKLRDVQCVWTLFVKLRKYSIRHCSVRYVWIRNSFNKNHIRQYPVRSYELNVLVWFFLLTINNLWTLPHTATFLILPHTC
jgi:hypothetical protein